jgi:hypothetical protein
MPDDGPKRTLTPDEIAIQPGMMLEWANLIELAVKTQCGERVIFKGRIERNGRFHIDFEPSDGSLCCATGVMRGHMEMMHRETQSVSDVHRSFQD